MSKTKMLLKYAAAFAAGAFLFAGSAAAQSNNDRKVLLKKFLDASDKIPAHHKKLLSSGMQNFLHYAAAVNASHSKTADDGGTLNVSGRALSAAVKGASPFAGISAAGPGGTVGVSNPALDFVGSIMTGFTQSETSSAWCGNAIVAGYNDSGAVLRSAGNNPLAPASLSGVSYSTDGGRSFVDLGFLNPGTDGANFLIGDPTVGCSSSSQFYYTSIFATATPPDINGNRNPLSAVSINASSTGGASWSAPIAVVAKDGFLHSLDKPWHAVDPTNQMRLYVTYTDFDFSGASTACPNDFRLAIELVSSTDGGNTWGAPLVIDEECGASLNGVQGSNVQVAGEGKVYVAFEFFPVTPDNEIHIRTSADHGQTFGAPVVITNAVVPNGSGGLLQGGFRNNEFPQLAVDRSKGPSRGTVYVAWSDGRDNVIPDLASFTGTYAFPDILVAKSTDSGQTFTTPNAVSPMEADFTGLGRDQFFPGIAVDGEGRVGVCYYDRRNDPGNTIIDRFCSVSHNHGASWNEHRVSHSNWLPLHGSDVAIVPTYIGDYDALTSDFLLRQDGFFGTFEIQTNGNPDVIAKKF